MQLEAVPTLMYVIKARQIGALSFLASDHPHPHRVEWINRGTDQSLRPSTVHQLLRTLHRVNVSPSVLRLQESAGLRMTFRDSHDRHIFAGEFRNALLRERQKRNQAAAAGVGLKGQVTGFADWLQLADIRGAESLVLMKAC